VAWFKGNKIIIIKLSSITQFLNRRGIIFLIVLFYLPGNILPGPLPSRNALAQDEVDLILHRVVFGSPIGFADERALISEHLKEEEILYIENIKAVPVAIRENPNAGKKVAITFDDGPYKDMTEKYISILEAHNATATFFLVGNRAQAYPEQAKIIAERGYEIGGHSYSHSNIREKAKQIIEADFKKNIDVIENITGAKVSLFRPPYGASNSILLHTAVAFSQQTVNWNVDPKDWSGVKPEEIVKRVISNTKDGSIILLHEGRQNTLQALPYIIQGLKEMGYELVTVSELLAASEPPIKSEPSAQQNQLPKQKQRPHHNRPPK
jgi:peptidoglycan/xylan/chitin deacetylase (PgdA/CDA1 family)